MSGPAKDFSFNAVDHCVCRVTYTSSILCYHVQHWLNGELLVEYDLGSPDWESRVAASKFARWPRYGRVPEGRIALQDHGDPVWFRNLRIRRL